MSDTAATDAAVSSGADGTSAESQLVETKTVEWYEAELSKVRDEAAKHRVRAKEAGDAAKVEAEQAFQVKLAEATAAVESVQAEARGYQSELAKLKAALGVVDAEALGRAEKVAGLLHGVTVDEITAQAEAVQGLLGESWGRTPAVDPSPEGKPLALNDDDGLLSALKGAVGIS